MNKTVYAPMDAALPPNSNATDSGNHSKLIMKPAMQTRPSVILLQHMQRYI